MRVSTRFKAAVVALAASILGVQPAVGGADSDGKIKSEEECERLPADAEIRWGGLTLELDVKRGHAPLFITRSVEDVPTNLIAIFKEDPKATVFGEFLVCPYPYTRWNKDLEEEMLVVQIRSATVSGILH